MLCSLGFAAMKLEDNKYCTYVPLVLIIVIKVSHCSDIRPMLWLNQNGRDIIFLIHVLRRCWSTLNTALPWIALRLSGSHCDWCYIWGNRSDLTFPWIVSLDRALNDDIIFHKELKRKFMTSQHRCVFVYIQHKVYELNGVILAHDAVSSLFRTVCQHQIMWFLAFLSDVITLNIFSEEKHILKVSTP